MELSYRKGEATSVFRLIAKNAMATSTASEFKGKWQHLARLLPLNSASEVDGMITLLVKVLDNVMAHPEEPKFHQLKLSNGAVKRKIADVKGGLEILRHVGFLRSTDGAGEAFLVVEQLAGEERAPERAARDAAFGGARAWLLAQQAAVAQLARERAAARASGGGAGGAGAAACPAAGAPLAECTLAVRMASGATVTGAFRAGDTLGDVRAFVAAFRAADAPPPVICANCPHREFADAAALATTLAEAALVPRAAVFVKRDGKVAVAVTESLQETRAVDRGREIAARAKRAADKKAVADARQQSIESFRADREDDAQRAVWRKAANVRAQERARAAEQEAAQREAALLAVPVAAAAQDGGGGGGGGGGGATIFSAGAAGVSASSKKSE